MLRAARLAPRIRIRVFGLKLCVLIDSGSTFTLIDLEWAKKHHPSFEKNFTKHKRRPLVLGDGNTNKAMTPLGYLKLKVDFGPCETETLAWVVSSLPELFVLGMQFFEDHRDEGADVSLRKQQFYIQNHAIDWVVAREEPEENAMKTEAPLSYFPAMLVKELELPPLSVTKAPSFVKLPPDADVNAWGTFEPLKEKFDRNCPYAVWKTSFGHLTNGMVDLWITNFSEVTLLIPANSPVALFNLRNIEEHGVTVCEDTKEEADEKDKPDAEEFREQYIEQDPFIKKAKEPNKERFSQTSEPTENETQKPSEETSAKDYPDYPDKYFTEGCLDPAKLPEHLEGLKMDLDNMKLTPVEACRVIDEVCMKHPDLFTNTNIPGLIPGVEASVTLKDPTLPPWNERLKPCAPADKIELRKLLDSYLKLGIIKESHSPFASRCLLVRKSSGRHQIAACLNTLNDRCVHNSYPLPLIRDNLDCLAGAKYITSIDACQAYHSVPVKESDQEKFAFITHHGLFEYCRMPYGWTNSGPIWYEIMDRTLRGLKWNIVCLYADDVIVFSSTFEQHLKDLNTVFERMKGFHLSTAKCLFAQKKIDYLGFIISSEGVKPCSKNIKKIQEMKIDTPKSIKSFLGMTGFYRRWILGYALLTRPLVDFTMKKDLNLKAPPEVIKAVQTLKDKLTSEPILRHPQFDLPMFLETDASKSGQGAILFQINENKQRQVIGYASQAFKDKEKDWPAHEKECSAAAFGMSYFHHYLIGREFTLLTDSEAIKFLKHKDLRGRLAKWKIETQAFTYKVQHVPGPRHLAADFMSRVGAEQAPVDKKARSYLKRNYLSMSLDVSTVEVPSVSARTLKRPRLATKKERAMSRETFSPLQQRPSQDKTKQVSYQAVPVPKPLSHDDWVSS